MSFSILTVLDLFTYVNIFNKAQLKLTAHSEKRVKKKEFLLHLKHSYTKLTGHSEMFDIYIYIYIYIDNNFCLLQH